MDVINHFRKYLNMYAFMLLSFLGGRTAPSARGLQPGPGRCSLRPVSADCAPPTPVPELPEVETVRRGLSPVMEGATIARADVNRPDLRWPLPERMAERLTGQRVRALRRRSKYILADLSSGETLIIHLGMSGRILVAQGAGPAEPGRFHHR